MWYVVKDVWRGSFSKLVSLQMHVLFFARFSSGSDTSNTTIGRSNKLVAVLEQR